MLLCVVVVFLLCNVWALISNVAEAFYGITVDQLVKVSNLLVTINSSVNFVIYVIFGEKFKRLFFKLFFPRGACICGWHPGDGHRRGVGGTCGGGGHDHDGRLDDSEATCNGGAGAGAGGGTAFECRQLSSTCGDKSRRCRSHHFGRNHHGTSNTLNNYASGHHHCGGNDAGTGCGRGNDDRGYRSVAAAAENTNCGIIWEQSTTVTNVHQIWTPRRRRVPNASCGHARAHRVDRGRCNGAALRVTAYRVHCIPHTAFIAIPARLRYIMLYLITRLLSVLLDRIVV